jgi:hypothetical protein
MGETFFDSPHFFKEAVVMTRTEIVARIVVYSILLVGLTLHLAGQWGYLWVAVDYVENGTARLDVNGSIVHVPTWTLMGFGEGDVILGDGEAMRDEIARLQRQLIKR